MRAKDTDVQAGDHPNSIRYPGKQGGDPSLGARGTQASGAGTQVSKMGPKVQGTSGSTRTWQEFIRAMPGLRVVVGSEEVGDDDGASWHRDTPNTRTGQGAAGMDWDRLECAESQ